MEYIARHEKLFIVGGCVRDAIMGKEPKDIDYCFAGSEQELLELFPTASKVGISFPVYLVDGCEVALTRTEQSTGDGYGDFAITAVGVSIEEDLNRRDFTMNQIAINTLTGEIVDPTGGKSDIENKIIRTTNKNAFIEDPVRILRGLRFSTTMMFDVEFDTMVLMMNSMKSLENVTKERIVKELEKMYSGAVRPSRFFNLLSIFGGLDQISPVLKKMEDVPAGPVQYHGYNTVFMHTMEVIDRVKAQNGSFSAFIAALTHDFGKVLTPADVLPHHYGHEYVGIDLAKEFIESNRFDAYTNDLILVAMRNHMKAHTVTKMKPVKIVRFVKGVPKHMVSDFMTVAFSDHVPTVEQKTFMESVFNFVNSFRMSSEEIAKVNSSSDKKQTVENIVSKHVTQFLKTMGN